MTLTVGSTLQAGKYVIQAMADYGELEVVYHAKHTPLNQTVVLKTLNENLRDHPDFERFSQRLIESATHLARCQHPNLVRVLDCFDDQGIPYIAVEHIAGQSLATVIRDGQSLSGSQALLYIRQVGVAINHVHQQGLVYRCVEPQFIIRNYGTDHVVLTGVGLGALFPLLVESSALSALGAGVQAPALWSDSPGTPASDISAIARTLFFLLTGDRLLDADAVDRSTLRQRHPHLPAGVEAAIRRGVTHEASLPPIDLMEWLDSLDQVAAPQNTNLSFYPQPTTSMATQVVRPELSPEPVTSFEGRSPLKSEAYYQPVTRRSKPWLAMSLVATSVIAAGAGAYLGFSLRFQETNQLSKSPIFGREIFGSEQSFSPSNHWPGLDRDEISTSRVLFERSGTQSTYAEDPEPDLFEPLIREEEDSLPEPDPLLGSEIISDPVDDWTIEFSPLPPLDPLAPEIPAPPPLPDSPSAPSVQPSPAPSPHPSGSASSAPPKVVPAVPASELLPLPESPSSDRSL